VDGWGWNDVAFTYAAVTRPVNLKKGAAEWRLFGIYYHDWRPVLKTDNRALAVRRSDLASLRIGSFGGHYLHLAETASGPVDLMAWGVAQTGRWGVLDHRAGALALEAGWQPKALPKLKPWIRGGYFYGSGDGNANDSSHNTFFQMLPTPRPFARFPFFNLMNNHDVLGMLAIRPRKAVTLKTEYHHLRLAAGGDLWLQGGGVFQPWSFGYVGRAGNGASGLADLSDISADWTVNSRLNVTAYYGYARGGDVIRSIYPRGKNGAFGYLELTWKF
jgi:hypothetical protein